RARRRARRRGARARESTRRTPPRGRPGHASTAARARRVHTRAHESRGGDLRRAARLARVRGAREAGTGARNDMAPTSAQLTAILERLEPLPVTARKMFGEYALYLDGRIPAFITDGVLGLKITDYADDRLTPELRAPIYAGSKDYWRIPAELLEDEDWIREAF